MVCPSSWKCPFIFFRQDHNNSKIIFTLVTIKNHQFQAHNTAFCGLASVVHTAGASWTLTLRPVRAVVDSLWKSPSALTVRLPLPHTASPFPGVQGAPVRAAVPQCGRLTLLRQEACEGETSPVREAGAGSKCVAPWQGSNSWVHRLQEAWILLFIPREFQFIFFFYSWAVGKTLDF